LSESKKIKGNVSREFLAELYRKIFTIRVFESECVKLYRQGLIIGYFHPYLGEEAIAVGACAALRDDDYIVSTHRGHGHCVARGGRLKPMVAEVLGRETGYCHGRGGSMHIADVATGNIGANGIVGAGMPIGVGAAMGVHVRGGDQVSVVFFSDGASNNGVFAESLNLAGIWHLPVVFVLENNQYAVSSPIEEMTREPELYKRGLAYGIESRRIDGNDVLEVYKNTREAVELCRAGKGPVLLEAMTYRHGGHHVNDPGTYMPDDKMAHYRSRDPVDIAGNYLREQYGVSDAEIAAIDAQVQAEMNEAIAFAQASPLPSVADFLAEVENN
jgi:pyruvate dehydrogenase E1 component alpha subunit